MENRRRDFLRFTSQAVELFEDKVLLSAAPALLSHDVRAIHHDVSRFSPSENQGHPQQTLAGHAQLELRRILAKHGAHPLAGNGPSANALTPAQTRHIYGIDQISDLGAGQTIAIVDAYDDPNISSDADVFDQQFMTTLGGSTSYYTAYGASSVWLTQAYASGTRPPGNTGWGQEISLDVEWAHAIAPQAHILLVEANSNSFADLLAADDYAISHGASVISNSWGGGESRSETGYDSHFTAQGVTFVFSAGDSGNQSYPAESPYVVSVGGTTLSHDSNYNWTNEVGWRSGGGGVSRYERKPSYQKSLSYSKRANPDVAYDADPNSGFAVYDSYGGYGWNYIFGGTSAGAPQWSALFALANQARVRAQKAVLDGFSQTLPAIYAMSSGTTGTEQLNDVTSGRNSVGSAGPGFDLVTGRGTPRRGELVYQALVNY
jgi:subtilase family serine protease